jgi:16S rRNA processing protein RimM
LTVLPAGRVGRAHGLDGSFYVTGAQLRLLSVGTKVTVGELTAPIVRLAGLEKHPIVRLEGVENRTAADALRGAALTVEQGEAPALQPGEWWAHELEGCAVGDGERKLGTVERLVELPSCEALQVRLPDGGERLVPMVADAIRTVDVERRRVDVNLAFLGDTWT